MVEDSLSEAVIGACMEVHRHIGPGLLESLYEECLCHELGLRGIDFARQVPVPMVYKGLELGPAYRIDLVADNRLIIELKSVECLLPIHEAQLYTYLRTSRFDVGLLVNFNVALLKHGLRRLTSKNNELLPLSSRSPHSL
jgi:GxxExxY protein